MLTLIRRLADAGGALAGLAVFAIFVTMLGSAVLRGLGLPTGGTDDVVSWLTAAAAFFGLAHAFLSGDFVRVGLLIERLPPVMRRLAECGALSIAGVFSGWLTWSVGTYVIDSWRFGDMANGLVVIPIWIPQSSLVIGCALLFLAVCGELARVLLGGRPAYVEAVEARHARGDFSEDV